MLASQTSRWTAGAVLLTVLLLAATWFLLISPRRSDAAATADQTLSAQSQASLLQTQITQLKSEFGNLRERRDELAAIKKQLPNEADVAGLVRNLQDYASASGVSLDSVEPGTPTIATGEAGAAATTAKAGDVVSIPMAISVSGDYFEAALFVKSLQTTLPRAFLITGLTTSEKEGATTTSGDVGATPTAAPTASTSAATGPVTVSLNISDQIFVLLDDETTLLSVAQDAQEQAAAGAQSPAAQASAAATAQAGAAAN